MLQQTTVPTVKGYFERFTKRWPTIQDLAAADQTQVLGEWAGLGYYARARNLYKCAGVVADDFGGEFPKDEASLKSLPGIGDYTSAAIAAIAFNERAAPVDGNIERVYARLFRIFTPLPKAKSEVKVFMEATLPTKLEGERYGDFAQALMDLGSSLCKAKRPLCDECPLAGICEGFKAGDAATYPVKAPKKKKPTRYGIAFWLTDKAGRGYFEVRPEKGLLGGMLGVPHSPWDTNPIDEVADLAHAPTVAKWEKLDGIVKHTFTHFHLEMTVYQAAGDVGENLNGKWLDLGKLKGEAIPTVMMKVVKHVDD
jgi:A/G-specific adenine glycosylase